MAFDQTPTPKDTRPLNIARTIPEEPRIVAAIASATSSSVTTPATAGRKHEFFASPEGSIPVIYPASVSDAGFVGLGYGNAFRGCPVGPTHAGSGVPWEWFWCSVRLQS